MKKLFYFTFLLIAGIGCSNIDNDKKIKEDEEKKNRWILVGKRGKRINSLCEQFDAVKFPAADIDANSNTLKIQTFFKENKTVLFDGKFEDVFEKDGETIVVLSFSIGGLFNDEAEILFNLSVPENLETLFKDKPKEDGSMFSLPSWLDSGDYYVVCECYSVNKTNVLDSAEDEEGNTIEVIKKAIIVTGKLIKAVEIPK